MRIGLMIYGSLYSRSGGYLYDRKLVERLQQHGDSLFIISLPNRSYTACLADNFSLPLFRRLLAMRLDVLLQDELNHPSLVWLNHGLRRQAPYRLVSIVHHLRCSESRPAWQNLFYRYLERSYLQSVHGFVFNSQSTSHTVEALAGCGRPSLIAYPAADHVGPGVSAETAARRALADSPLRLLFIGNLIPRKGLHVLLEALARLPNDGWHLTVVGSPSVDRGYAAKAQKQVRRLGLTDKVLFTGSLTQPALQTHLQDSHVLVGPSSYEGFGIVYLEGMAYGLPAVASAAGAAGEIVRDGENGFLIAPEDKVDLSKKLRYYLENRPALARAAQQALETYKHHPTWDSTGDRIRHFLQHRILRS